MSYDVTYDMTYDVTYDVTYDMIYDGTYEGPLTRIKHISHHLISAININNYPFNTQNVINVHS